MTDFALWTKRNDAIYMQEHEDVSVLLSESLDGTPFIGVVGKCQGAFEDLDSAMDWCEQTARGRTILTGPDPLPADTLALDAQYLEDRGLA